MGTVFDRASGMLFPLRVESTMTHLLSSQPHIFGSFLLPLGPIPFMVGYQVENLQVQSPGTETPLSLMAIGALEVCAANLALRRNVPAAASLVGDEGKLVVIGDLLSEERVMVDGS